MVIPEGFESMLLRRLRLTLKLRKLKPEAELGLLGEVEILLRADDNASASGTVLSAKVQP